MSLSSGEAMSGEEKATAVLAAVPESPEDRTWFSRHWQKFVALVLWGLLIFAYIWYTRAQDLSPLQAVRALIDLMQSSVYGPVIYIALYALRPLLFFSSVLLTLAGGFIFGPVWGIVLTVLAANTSAMVAYTVGRFFGEGVLDEENSGGLVQRYATRMRNNSFETILIMRFIYLPYDFVNYLAGFLRIDWKAFLLATALGSIPGTISFVLVGASVDGNFDGGIPDLKPWVLVMSALMFAVSLGLSRYFKSRESMDQDSDAGETAA